ncbi:MAG TPA: hypothetical protein VH396_16550, partial [Chitinophagaceae bacterium]
EYNLIWNFGSFPSIRQEVHEANEAKRKLSNYIDDFIETINSIGLPKKPNFLYRLTNLWLTIILTLLIPSLITASTLWGKYLSDTQNIELKQEVKSLRDSLKLLSPKLQKTNNVSNKKTDSTNR